jgi:hypothetical protein
MPRSKIVISLDSLLLEQMDRLVSGRGEGLPIRTNWHR